jgi:hypothetical protein
MRGRTKPDITCNLPRPSVSALHIVTSPSLHQGSISSITLPMVRPSGHSTYHKTTLHHRSLARRHRASPRPCRSRGSASIRGSALLFADGSTRREGARWCFSAAHVSRLCMSCRLEIKRLTAGEPERRFGNLSRAGRVSGRILVL